MTAWQDRHLAALTDPEGAEVPLMDLIDAMHDAQAAHKAILRHVDDMVLGQSVEQVRDATVALGSALITLLNGDTGRLDPAAVDKYARRVVENVGGDPDEL